MDKPYVQRDTGARAGDDTTRVVIGDVYDILQAMVDEYTALRDKAKKLYEEAEALPWDEGCNWTDVDVNPDAPEILRDLLQEAEQLDHIYVDWDGDSGTATTTISDYWYEVESEDEDGG